MGATEPFSMPRVSVLMPTFGHARFIARAIESVLAQGFEDWELLVVDDGSPDDTADVVKRYLQDRRVTYERLPVNRGLGVALNHALGRARGRFIAYLPSDDVYYADHLRSLADLLDRADGFVLAFSGVRHHYNRTAEGQVAGEPLQLVQVMHRRTDERWTEREELVTDDLDRMFWRKLGGSGSATGTGQVTCEWVDHPAQRHKLLREPEGGINPYRARFGVPHPLRFHSTMGNRIDEVEHYRAFRERPETPPAADGLKILLVGELAYNAERVLALEERGHRLYGLWMPDPYWYNTVGPVPFGHVRDLPADGWRDAVAEVQPDVVYALLNWQVVPFAHAVLTALPDVPFVWHFKEGPFICLEKGTWPQLVDLYRLSDGQVYSSPEMQEWFATVVPELADRSTALVLDGDLPKRDWLIGDRSPRRSETDGELHTVVPGRPIGLHPPDVARLAEEGIHLHFYGDFTHGQWRAWIEKSRALAPRHLHLHAQVDQGAWVSEFSQYDAGWLHFFESENRGELRRANWDDLNYPARLATLIVAGLPVLQRDNQGSIVATQSLVRERDLGLFFSDFGELGQQLRDQPRMDRLRERVWQQREEFTFDFHADGLVDFLRRAIVQQHRRPCS
ncbi:MAG TPA: glycosyltransferase family 2 protein [Acidimicrobiales bacterium]|nr:glycosyltransferase family 2 protein [Acidimicrobiales bacterium]